MDTLVPMFGFRAFPLLEMEFFPYSVATMLIMVIHGIYLEMAMSHEMDTACKYIGVLISV